MCKSGRLTDLACVGGFRKPKPLRFFNGLACSIAQLTLCADMISNPVRIPMGNYTVPDQDLRDLEAKIEAAKQRSAPAKPHQEEHYSQAQLAWRMVIELVGFGIGYGLDWLFGTLPIFMVLFVMLGLAAGVKTMLRSAQEIQNKKMADEASRNAPLAGDKNEGA